MQYELFPGPHRPSIVWIHVAFSARFPDARNAIQERLSNKLTGTGITGIVTSRSVVLMSMRHVVGPAQWTDVIGWLLLQPEVVFVARLLPMSRRSSVCG